MNQARIQVASDRKYQGGTFAWSAVAGGFWLRLILDDGRQFEATEGDLFEGLIAIRRELDDLGARPLCFGARRDVWASGMARDMEGGVRAYQLWPGQRPSLADLSGIFEPANDQDVGSVTEQKEEFESWVASIRAGATDSAT